MSKTCTYPACERGCYGEFCLMHKPRKPLKSSEYKPTLSSKRKAIKPIGKHGDKWRQTKVDWMKANPASNYQCHYCLRVIPKRETSLDHKIPRSRAPELRYDFDNLVPCCWFDNGQKGSVDHDTYTAKYYPGHSC